jgi:hypothetical protein
MKRLILLLLIAIVSCEKQDDFNFYDVWWGGESYGGNREIFIKFISDTEFKFDSEAPRNRYPFMSGTGKYTKKGNDIIFDFETRSYDLFAPSYIKLISGTWENYPASKMELARTRLTIKFVEWTQMTNEISTEKKQLEKTFKWAIRD